MMNSTSIKKWVKVFWVVLMIVALAAPWVLAVCAMPETDWTKIVICSLLGNAAEVLGGGLFLLVSVALLSQ